MIQLEFGYLPKRIDTAGGDWSITTLPDFQQTVSTISEHSDVRNRWIYPNLPEISPSVLPHPRLFALPKTHLIEHQNASADQIRFLIWALSFFYGIRLTSEPMGFLDAATTETGMLVDFHCHSGVIKVMALAETFWLTNAINPQQPKRFAAAVHALFIAQGPQLWEFERFLYLYTALDTCFALLWDHSIFKRQKPNHTERLQWMCNLVGVPVPAWAVVNANGSSEISILRNDATHEALFSGEPYGFAVVKNSQERNLPLEMKNLTCRLLAHIIGVRDMSYIGMPTDIYGRHGLDL